MKTIFRYTNIGFLLAAIFAVGAVAGNAQDPVAGVVQDPCADAEGQTALGDRFRAEFPVGTIPGRKKTIETGKQFLEKYGACETAKDLSDYLKTTLPKLEATLKELTDAEAKTNLLETFNGALKTSNWDVVYSSGKEILQKYPEEFRTVELVLGSIGLDETIKVPRVTKWNDETIRFAKMSIADLEAGKKFDSFGVNQFKYNTKDNALGWMNYTLGYIYFFDKNDKKLGLSHLYKATQLASDTKTNPIVYQTIGSFYFDEVVKLAKEVDDMIKAQADTDTPEVAEKKIADIKAKVALVNGTAEAGIDAYGRAHTLAKADSKLPPEYKNVLLKRLQELYNVRFGKMDGFDAFVANTIKKPLPNPLDPVTPVSDPEPTTTTTTSTPAAAAAIKPAASTAKPKN